jgi:hypothetical protein
MRALDSRHKRGRIPMVCIFNCVRHIPKEEAAAREELSQACPDLAICPTTIYDRKVFRDVSWIGKSILEMPKRESERAVEEFTKAMKYAFAQAKRLSASTSGDPVEAKKPRRNERRTTSPTMEAGS